MTELGRRARHCVDKSRTSTGLPGQWLLSRVSTV